MTISTVTQLMTLIVLVMVAGTPATAQTNTMTAQEKANVQFVLDWWREVVEARHLDLAAKYMAEDYIQHDINVPTGRAGFVKFLRALGPPINPMPATLQQPPVISFAKGDFVVLIFEREARDPGNPSRTYKHNTYDMLRMQNGKLQEHWDYAIKTPKIPRGGAPDGIDYTTLKFNQSPEEQKVIEIATVEFKDILQYGHVELADKVMAPGYIQHNPNVPTGRQPFVEFFSKIRKPEPIKAEWKDKPEVMFASGPYFFLIQKRELEDPDDKAKTYPAYWFDLVRVENGLIQEHWDSAMKSPPPAGR